MPLSSSPRRFHDAFSLPTISPPYGSQLDSAVVPSRSRLSGMVGVPMIRTFLNPAVLPACVERASHGSASAGSGSSQTSRSLMNAFHEPSLTTSRYLYHSPSSGNGGSILPERRFCEMPYMSKLLRSCLTSYRAAP